MKYRFRSGEIKVAYLEDMAPILALIVKTFIEHFHDLDKVPPLKVRL
jgi:hypothetical protein